ncbi:prolyl oligopeptidase family serine peptidase [Microvirga sp. c23x22]|uniref:Prolyl oligopeptidase family serine peptidase n=2 Tax=Microvirga terricola TaxID=2719797 RepID=A0ABX0VGC5_9HYPH|nr:prolyl oligopeptidase family serine peptidase [Microvirga terricola]
MPISLERRTFTSGGKDIAVETLQVEGLLRPPAVVMLHGADGLSENVQYYEGAQVVAAAGFQVNLIHYLDRTEENRASFNTLFQNFQIWLETVNDSLAWVADRTEVDTSRIGIIGVSLGAALGLAAASADRRIKALVHYFGPLPQGAIAADAHLPPTLVLHGALDAIVPVANAYAVEALLRQQDVPHEIMVYPDQGHGFRGDARTDALERVVAFLGHYLAGHDASPLSGRR